VFTRLRQAHNKCARRAGKRIEPLMNGYIAKYISNSNYISDGAENRDGKQSLNFAP
jgi:hypothetical protein